LTSQDANMARAIFPRFLCLAPALALAGAALASTPLIGPDSGKPVPRFESLKYGEVNGRQGPSLEQRILWTYHRRGLPVQIVAESGSWRRVKDPDGDLAWISAAMLEDRRMTFVAAPEATPLRGSPKANGRVVAMLAPGTVAQLKACKLGWRSLKVGGREGWVPVSVLWGADTCG
jgi:SH3-like domain-containing protein